MLSARAVQQEHPSQRTLRLPASCARLCHGALGIFLTTPLSYAAVASPGANMRSSCATENSQPVLIMASATSSASVPGESISAPAERGVAGRCRHAEWPTRSSPPPCTLPCRVSASDDHACTKANYISCIPLPICDKRAKYVGILRQSCKERKKK